MVTDPERHYDAVRAERGEAEAARSLIQSSKGLAAGFAIALVVFVGAWFGSAIYAQGRINSCRDLVEDRHHADVGQTIVEYRLTGSIRNELVERMQRHVLDMNNITSVCPSAFWPWDLPNEPPVEEPLPPVSSIPLLPATPAPTTSSTLPD
jgi:hypothetical protein